MSRRNNKWYQERSWQLILGAIFCRFPHATGGGDSVRSMGHLRGVKMGCLDHTKEMPLLYKLTGSWYIHFGIFGPGKNCDRAIHPWGYSHLLYCEVWMFTGEHGDQANLNVSKCQAALRGAIKKCLWGRHTLSGAEKKGNDGVMKICRNM